MPKAESKHTPGSSERDVIAPGSVSLFDIEHALVDVRGATDTLVELVEACNTPDDRINIEVLDWLSGQLQEHVKTLYARYEAFARDCMGGAGIAILGGDLRRFVPKGEMN